MTSAPSHLAEMPSKMTPNSAKFSKIAHTYIYFHTTARKQIRYPSITLLCSGFYRSSHPRRGRGWRRSFRRETLSCPALWDSVSGLGLCSPALPAASFSNENLGLCKKRRRKYKPPDWPITFFFPGNQTSSYPYSSLSRTTTHSPNSGAGMRSPLLSVSFISYGTETLIPPMWPRTRSGVS